MSEQGGHGAVLMNSIVKNYRMVFLLIASAMVIFAGVGLLSKVRLLRMAETVTVPVSPDSEPQDQGKAGRW